MKAGEIVIACGIGAMIGSLIIAGVRIIIWVVSIVGG